MRILIVLLVLVGLTLSACGSDDSAGSGSPIDLVETEGLVMDTGTPQLCQGPIAESWPPQCTGAELRGWDWAGQRSGSYERVGEVRWGEYVLTGSWDGDVFVVSDAVPATPGSG